MRVESRYCDDCGVKIPLDDLSDGSAVEVEESVFYCRECRPKHVKKAEPIYMIKIADMGTMRSYNAAKVENFVPYYLVHFWDVWLK